MEIPIVNFDFEYDRNPPMVEVNGVPFTPKQFNLLMCNADPEGYGVLTRHNFDTFTRFGIRLDIKFGGPIEWEHLLEEQLIDLIAARIAQVNKAFNIGIISFGDAKIALRGGELQAVDQNYLDLCAISDSLCGAHIENGHVFEKDAFDADIYVPDGVISIPLPALELIATDDKIRAQIMARAALIKREVAEKEYQHYVKEGTRWCDK